ncbi:hypothetical protein ACQJBY_007180 [Aegilops geniculata]
MLTGLFNRNRGRESATSTRYSIRRAGGGSSLMARARTAMGRCLRRRRPRASRRDDRISALPDDLLLSVLRRLDIRTALGTAALSRRWARLNRELPVLSFSVEGMLPARYHRWVQLCRDIGGAIFFQYERDAMTRELMPNITRYEHRAMRALTRSVESFLGTVARRRRVTRLRVEFFVTHNTGCLNQLIAEAVDAWGVDDLEAVAKPIYNQPGAVHSFGGHGGLCKEPSAARLQSLKLGGCVLPPLHEYGALTTLVLQDIPDSTPEGTYEGVFTSCLQLQVLHLISCRCSGGRGVVVDAPMSKIRELVVEKCRFRRIRLRALPSLENLASEGIIVHLEESTSFPRLRKYNLTLCLGMTLRRLRQALAQHLKIEPETFLRRMPGITSLILRLTGPDRWIVPSSPPSPPLLPNLRRLLVADVPSSWDVSWPRLLLETAPSLETLHVHIAACVEEEPGDEIPWRHTMVRHHHHLEEFVMVGYEGTKRQTYFVKFLMGVCTVLRNVTMFRNGHARNKGHWDWELVTHQHLWTDEEKDDTLKHVMDGVSPSAAQVRLVLG